MQTRESLKIAGILFPFLVFLCLPASGAMFFPLPGESVSDQNQQSPGAAGLNASIVNALSGTASRWALWRHGYLIHVEGSFNSEIEVKSLRKTWHALIVGAGIKQGKIPSLAQKISVWQTQLSGNDANAAWKHVITQSAGFDYPGCGHSTDYEPGTMWTYSDLNLFHLCNALAKAYGRRDYYDTYGSVVREAYFDSIGMQGWSTSTRADGIRFHFDLEDMGRLGLLVLARGQWAGREIIPQGFVEALETKQTYGMRVNYNGCNDGVINLDPGDFPESPYGYLTWCNTDGDYYPGADTAWAWGYGAGGTYILWNRNNGIVYAGVGTAWGPTANGIPHKIENNITGPNPLLNTPTIAGMPVPARACPFSVFPNPLAPGGPLYLSMDREQAGIPFTLSLFNAAGRTVYGLKGKGAWNGHLMLLNTAGLARGTYFVRFNTGEKTFSRRLVLR
jgi:hypothetical protein